MFPEILKINSCEAKNPGEWVMLVITYIPFRLILQFALFIEK